MLLWVYEMQLKMGSSFLLPIHKSLFLFANRSLCSNFYSIYAFSNDSFFFILFHTFLFILSFSYFPFHTFLLFHTIPAFSKDFHLPTLVYPASPIPISSSAVNPPSSLSAEKYPPYFFTTDSTLDRPKPCSTPLADKKRESVFARFFPAAFVTER